MRTRPLLALLAAGVGALTSFTAPAATAAESGTLACRDVAYYWDAGYGDLDGNPTKIPGKDPYGEHYDHEVLVGGQMVRVYRASTRCNDVNLKITNFAGSPYIAAKVCYPSAGWCEQSKYFDDSEVHAWKVIKAGIPNGTTFTVEFDYNAGRIEGVIAY